MYSSPGSCTIEGVNNSRRQCTGVDAGSSLRRHQLVATYLGAAAAVAAGRADIISSTGSRCQCQRQICWLLHWQVEGESYDQ